MSKMLIVGIMNCWTIVGSSSRMQSYLMFLWQVEFWLA